MNEDFLPDNYRAMAQTQTIEEYLNNLYSHASFARDHIQWYIDYIREILNEMSFPCSDTLDMKTKKGVLFLQKKRDKQLEALNISENTIKEDVNNLLNAMAGSVNHKWDDYNLGKIIGFQSDEIKCLDDPIPLPIQSLFYVSSLTYGYLVQHAINAMILKYRVVSLTEKDPSKKEDSLYNELKRFLACGFEEINNQMIGLQKGQEQTQKGIEQIYKKQKELNDKTERNQKLIINRNEIDEEKTGTLSIEQCVTLIGIVKDHYYKQKIEDCKKAGFPPSTVKKLEKKTIRRYVEFWDQYIKSNKKLGRKPPGKDYSRNMSQNDYSQLINEVELKKYNRWRARNKIVERLKVHKNHE